MLSSKRQSKSLADTVRGLFGAASCKTQVAALPWRIARDGVEIMLVTSRDTGRWVLPKGWPEAGERLCDAAAREAAEEAGISGAVGAAEIGVYHYAKQHASRLDEPCRVHVFAMEIDRVREKWPERRERKRAWFSPGEAASLVRESDLGALILAFCDQPRRFVGPAELAPVSEKGTRKKGAHVEAPALLVLPPIA